MLRALGIPRDGTLLVHSAFRGFGRDGYDPAATVEALAAYMAPGTLLMPTMSWRFVKPDKPVFDELATPSNTGILTEVFRTKVARRRSLHPTHSVAGIGARALEFLGEHHLSQTPCDRQSPFGKLVELDAWVVMMGVGMDCCTLLHHVEESVAPDLYIRSASARERYVCRGRDGLEHEVWLRRHLFLPRDYWQFQDMLAHQGQLGVHFCDTSACLGFRAASMATVATEVLRRRPDAIIANPGQRYRMM